MGKIHEDEGIIVDVLHGCDRVCYDTAKYYYYLQRNNSITGVKLSEKSLAYFEFIEKRIEFFKSNYPLLYIKSIEDLFCTIMAYYSKNKHLAKKLNELFKKYAKQYKSERKKFSIRTKSKIFLFKFCKNLYGFIYRAKDKIKKKKQSM